MGRFYPFFLAGVFVLSTLCISVPASGKEIYKSKKSEEKVKNTMEILQEGLDELEEAVLKDDIPATIKITHELDEASHFICNINLSQSTLSKADQQEFERLRQTLHRRMHALSEAADEGNTDAVLEQSFKVRDACETCHHDFKKGRE